MSYLVSFVKVKALSHLIWGYNRLLQVLTHLTLGPYSINFLLVILQIPLALGRVKQQQQTRLHAQLQVSPLLATPIRNNIF